MQKEKVILEFDKLVEDREVRFYISKAASVSPGLNIREGFNREDYERMRTDEILPLDSRDIKAACMEAYKTIPLVKNTIDLMTDLVVQGVDVVAANDSAESFYKKWFWERVDGYNRSERMTSLVFRTGDAVAKRWMGRLNTGERIPYEYTLINPLILDVVNDELRDFIDTGSRRYAIVFPSTSLQLFQNLLDRSDPFLSSIPSSLVNMMKNALVGGRKSVELDPETISVISFKKDDWELWGTPICECILDDLDVLRKLRLADLSALDGAISKIRLWKVGHLDGQYTIPATKASLARLAEALSHIVPGGSTDIIWGPAIDFKESTTDVHKFLGPDKYIPTVRNILFGLGLPNILHGFGQSGSGMTNNMVEMKILIQRLKYMRMLLIKFWEKEFKIVQKAMGFTSKAQLVFDYDLMTDEATMLNILLSAADRNIVSDELVQERFNAIPEVERVRIKKQWKAIKNKKVPAKAGPFHDANTEQHLNSDIVRKIFENGQLGGDELEELTGLNLPKIKIEKPKGEIGQGRPNGAKDKIKRKQKRVVPIQATRDIVDFIKKYMWALEVHTPVLDYVTKAAASANITDQQTIDGLVFAFLCNSEYPNIPTEEDFAKMVQSKVSVPPEYQQLMAQAGKSDKDTMAQAVALLK